MRAKRFLIRIYMKISRTGKGYENGIAQFPEFLLHLFEQVIA